MRNRKFLFILLFSLTLTLCLHAAEQITRVGIVDSEFVASSFITKSKTYDDFETLKEEIETRIKTIQAEIAALEEKKIAAYENREQGEELRLAGEIQKQNNYLNEYMRWGKKEIENAKQRITANNDDFYKRLAKAIADTAEAEGFSIILDKKKVNIWYYIEEVDITDAVIKALNRMYG